MNRLQAAEQVRLALQMFAATLENDRAMEIAMVYPVWAEDRQYSKGDIVAYGVNGVGDPQLYRVAQGHKSQGDWLPNVTPALYSPIGISHGGYPLWSQPAGAHDAYNAGDVVDYNGVLYRSTVDGNVWSPDAYPDGWELAVFDDD